MISAKKKSCKKLSFLPKQEKARTQGPWEQNLPFSCAEKKTSMFGLGVNHESNYKPSENFKKFLKPILSFHYFSLVCVKIINP